MATGLPPGDLVGQLELRGTLRPAPQRLPRVPGNCKGMITLLIEDDEHLKDFEEYMK